MAEIKRDYAAEYQRRIAGGLANGLSKSQARGHRRATEVGPRSGGKANPFEDHKLRLALRQLRKEGSLSQAAKDAHIAPERLRRLAVEHGVIEKHGQRWKIKHELPRRLPLYSNGREYLITVGDFSEASKAGRYMAAVARFLATNDRKYLEPHIGQTITDITGKSYIVETRPNALYRLAHSSAASFEQIYRIVALP